MYGMNDLENEYVKLRPWHGGMKATHLPTGLEAFCRTEPTQRLNAIMAVSLLQSGLILGPLPEEARPYVN